MNLAQVEELIDLLRRIQTEGGSLPWALKVRLEEELRTLEEIADAMAAGV